MITNIQNTLPEYIAKTGNEAKDRLRLQHEVFAPGTQLLLKMSGFRPDMRILIIGCGCGDETLMIAQQMNEKGQIIAIDKSRQQIEQAQKLLENAKITTQVNFIASPVENLQLTESQFDLIITRFLIPHLANPKATIEMLINLLRSGGVLASQEPILSSCHTSPPSAALEKYLNLMKAFGLQNNLDFDMASTIPSLFSACGLITKSKNWRPIVVGENKRMVAMSAEECLPAIIKCGLISLEDAKNLIKAINQEVTLPIETQLFQCTNVLTVGFKAKN